MSGGYWNYRNGELADDLFGWSMDARYGETGHSQSSKARSLNPLEDREISEIVWDVFCLLNSFDYYKCSDTSKVTYLKDVSWFKNKWFNRSGEDRIAAYKQDLKDYCNKLMEEFENGV